MVLEMSHDTSSKDVREDIRKLLAGREALESELRKYAEQVAIVSAHVRRILGEIEKVEYRDSELMAEGERLKAIDVIATAIAKAFNYDPDTVAVDERLSLTKLLHRFAQHLVNSVAPVNKFATSILAFLFLPIAAAKTELGATDQDLDRAMEMLSLGRYQLLLLMPDDLSVLMPAGLEIVDGKPTMTILDNNVLLKATAILAYNILAWNYFYNSILLPLHNLILREVGAVSNTTLETPWKVLIRRYEPNVIKFAQNNIGGAKCEIWEKTGNLVVECSVPREALIEVRARYAREPGGAVEATLLAATGESKLMKLVEFLGEAQKCSAKAYCIPFIPPERRSSSEPALVLVSAKAFVEASISLGGSEKSVS